MFIRTRIQSRKAPQMSKLADMTVEEASKYGPYGKNDKPCEVICYGRRTLWKSRRAAKFFYTVAARMCAGSSEGGRYQRIAWEIEDGKIVATDGSVQFDEARCTKKCATVAELTGLMKRRDELCRLMDDARERGAECEAQKYADEWNTVSVEIIEMKKVMSARGEIPPCNGC